VDGVLALYWRETRASSGEASHMQQITPDVYRLSGLVMGSVYLIVDPDGLTLIDASIASAGPKILRQIADLGRSPGDVKRILITHGHPDHVGALPVVQRATGAAVWTSAIDRPVIEGQAPLPQAPPEKRTGLARFIKLPPQTLPASPVHRELREGEALPEVLGGIQVLATPGHTPGHLAFWQPERRILFCGDVIFHLPNLRLPIALFTVDMDENRRSVGRLAELDPAVVCFGHGSPLTENAAERLRTFAAKVAR
jgi:glyoxylase-like metal-dependent hydrolase (beta-lactamase superfamily II)